MNPLEQDRVLGTMFAPLQVKAKILWFSHGYGYVGRLMYFEPIFKEFFRRFPQTTIFVDHATYVNYPAFAPWFQEIRFSRFRLHRRMNGVPYDSEVKIPDLSLIAMIFDSRADAAILIEFTPIALIGFVVVKLLRRQPVLLLIENDPAYRGLAQQGLFRFVKRWVAQRVDRVMTNNNAGLAYVRDELGVPEERIAVAPYLTSQPAKASPRKEVTAAPDERVKLLFLNSVSERKGLLLLLKALHLMTATERSQIKLLVAGDGPQLGAARAYALSLDLGDAVEFFGRVPYETVGELYETADVMISPTLGDYRSLTGFEALAFGKPILMSRWDGAHPEVVKDGENGFLIDPLNPDDMAAKLSWCVENRGALPAMAQKSAAMAHQFSVETVVGNIESAVCNILKRGQTERAGS